jgi:hypothetical protein
MRVLKSTNRAELLLTAALVIFVFSSAFFHVSDADVGYHMRTAQHILAGNGIPTTNTFAYTTPDEPWLLHQWLGTLIFYAPYRLGGVTLLIAFKALVATGLMLLVWAAGRRLTGPSSLWPWWTVTLGVLIARVRFFERSDLLSALFCAALFYLDLRFNRNRRWQWIGVPLLIALWANVHAGVVYGGVLLGAFGAAEWLTWLWRRARGSAAETDAGNDGDAIAFKELWVRPIGFLLALLAALVSVQLINPNGCKVLWFPISQFGSSFWQATILEYQRPGLGQYKLFYLSLAALAVLQALTLRQAKLRLLLPAMAFGYLACSSQRSILFFVVTAMPHLAYMLSQLRGVFGFTPVANGNQTHGHRLGFVLLPLIWVAMVVGIFIRDPIFIFGPGFHKAYYPLEIYRFMEAEVPAQNLFNDMRYGGSMLWWLYPRFKPFIDGRGDTYSIEFWRTEYLPVLELRPNWQDILKKHNVTGVLLPIYEDRTMPALARKLRDDTDWALVAFNDATLLFLRRTAANHDVIERHEFREIWPGDWSLAALDIPGSRPQATAEARRSLELSPDSLFAQTAMARACLVNEQYGAAAEILRKFANDKNATANYLRDFGYALFRLGQTKEADQVFERMISKRLLIGFACYMRYFIACQEGQTANAQRFLTEAIKAEPGNASYREALNGLSASIK